MLVFDAGFEVLYVMVAQYTEHNKTSNPALEAVSAMTAVTHKNAAGTVQSCISKFYDVPARLPQPTTRYATRGENISTVRTASL